MGSRMCVKSSKLLALVAISFLNLCFVDSSDADKFTISPKDKNCFFKCADQLELLMEIEEHTPVTRFFAVYGKPIYKYVNKKNKSSVYIFGGETSDVYVKYYDNWVVSNIAVFSKKNMHYRSESIGVPFIKYDHTNFSRTFLISSSLPCVGEYEFRKYNGKDALIIPTCDMGRGSSFKLFSFLYWLTPRQLGCLNITNKKALKIINNLDCSREMDIVADAFFIGYEWNSRKIDGIVRCYFNHNCGE